MSKINTFDKFNESITPKGKSFVKHTFDQSKDDFEIAQKSILQSIENLIEEYNDFTMDVSPMDWRSTGHHLYELKKMKREIEDFGPISVEDKQTDIVRQSREEFNKEK